jgi:ubiquinone/menaquinone biosynthesis C-methylase UbiE
MVKESSLTNGSQRGAQEQFGRTAARYSVSRTHSGNDSLVDLTQFADFAGEHYGIAIDVGTGPGFTAFAMAPFADYVIATDVTPQMLEEVRALRTERGAGATQMVLAAAEALPFADGSIDLVTCRTAAHHFVDFAGWISEVGRVLRPGGLLLAADTCAPEDAANASWMQRIETDRDPSHVRNLAPSEWRKALEDAGFTVTDSAMSYVYLQYPDWAERSGMSEPGMRAVREELVSAPPEAKSAFGIEPHDDGTVHFHWDVVSLRATKD